MLYTKEAVLSLRGMVELGVKIDDRILNVAYKKTANANPAADRMVTDPINSRRTPSHRLALMDGMYARKLASFRHSFSSVNRSLTGKEPDIFGAIRFSSVLENVVFSPETRLVDYNNATLTENTRWYVYHSSDAIGNRGVSFGWISGLRGVSRFYCRKGRDSNYVCVFPRYFLT